MSDLASATLRRWVQRRLILLSSAVCAAALLVACGADGSSSGISRSSFVASANQICSRYYNKAYALPPPIGLTQLLELAGKQQALREQELSGLQKLTAPATERNAYGSYISNLVAADEDRAPSDGLAHAEVAYMRPRQPTPSLATLHAQLKPNGSERSIEAIKARERADVIHEARALRNATRPLSVSPRVRHSLSILVERAGRLEQEAANHAQQLGLTECAKDPYVAEHAVYERTFYEDTGENRGTQRGR